MAPFLWSLQLSLSHIYLNEYRVIQEEFQIKFEPEQCTELQTLAQLVEFLDAKSA